MRDYIIMFFAMSGQLPEDTKLGTALEEEELHILIFGLYVTHYPGPETGINHPTNRDVV